ncbi:hypothetical protein EU555_28795 [Methylobacterium nonmethylotrophicum]|uniref:Lactonase family protein n=1 Tax=Methylobacterium nonmethylotrophicum TaxID=1141884 RepID=A0A4Z0NGT0_9HYPH|nr:hypothetical protein EU555_28795 [Methylobacterium nonmethylotrophicum]
MLRPGEVTGRDLAAPLDFKGRMLVSVSDADMLASAYVNGELGPREGSDALAVVPLGAHPRDLKAFEAPVSNSVAGPPAAVAVSPDGRYAVVVETFAPRSAAERAGERFSDLRPGRALTVIDLGDPTRPTVVQVVEGLERPDSVSFSADGSLVAVTHHPLGAGRAAPIALYPFSSGRLGTAVAPAIPGWLPGDRLIHAEFHPHQSLLGLLNETKAEISFVRVEGMGEGVRLVAHGNTVRIEKSPYLLRFTPDGRHAVVNGLYWGPDVQGTWNEAPRGSVASVRLDAGRDRDGSPRHALVSRAQTGVSPEGLAVSPDGTLVVTTNLERSYLPYDDPRQTFFSSLTLLRLDPRTGALSRVGDFPSDGILPEAAAFDASGRYLAVTTYDHYDDRRRGGAIDFWRVARDPLDPARLELVRTEHAVPVTRGVHSMVLVK